MANHEQVDIETRAELDKLGHLLEVPVADLAGMASGGSVNLRRLRQRIHQRVFDDRRERFQRLEKLTRVLPQTAVAKFAVSAFGPRLSGRLVGEMNSLRAVKIAERLDPTFLADVALHVDPPKVHDIIARLPAELIRDAALTLVERKEYIVLGRFADALSELAIQAVVAAVDDDAALLHIAFYMEHKEQLTRFVNMIDRDRMASIMRTGTQRELWPEALSVIDNVDIEWRGRLANIMAELDEATLNGLVGVAHAQNLWGPVLRGMAHMNPKHYRKIVNLPAIRDETVLGDLINAAYAEGQLDIALPLTEAMRPDWQRVVAHAALKQGEEIAESVLWAAQASGRWDITLKLCAYTNDSERDMLARLPALQSKPVQTSALSAAILTNNVGILLDIVGRMDDDGQRAAALVLLEREAGLLESLLDTAASGDGLAVLANCLSHVDRGALESAALVFQRSDEGTRNAFSAAARKCGVWKKLAPVLEAETA